MQFTEILRSKIFFLELNRERRRSRMEESSKWERNLRQEYQNKNYRTSFADFHIFGYVFRKTEFSFVTILVWGRDSKISYNFF